MPFTEKESHSLTLVDGFVDGLLFPFRLGVLIYNLMGSVVIALMLIFLFSEVMSRQETVQHQGAEVLQTAESDSEKSAGIELLLAQHRANGASEEELEETRDFLMQGSAQTDEMVILEGEMEPLDFGILALMVLICLIVFAKNLDLTAQVAEGDFDSPSFSPVSHVSPFIVLKAIGVWALLILIVTFFSIGLGLLSIFIPFVIWLVFPLYFILFLGYPAIILTLIRTDSVFETVNFRNWLTTINQHVGQINYLILLGMLFIVGLISVVTEVLTSRLFSGASLGLLFATTALAWYCSFHLLSTNHFLMGCMAQNDTDEAFKGDFGGHEKKNSRNKTPTVLDDVDMCLASGYSDDAITLLKQALNNSEGSASEKLALMKKLESIFAKQGNARAVMQTQNRMLHFVVQDAPQLKDQVASQIRALTQSADFTPTADEMLWLAQMAFSEKDYESAFKMAVKFVKAHPNHAHSIDCYIIAGRALAKKRQYVRAQKALAKVLKTLPQDDQRYLEVKSEYLMLKRKVESSANTGNSSAG